MSVFMKEFMIVMGASCSLQHCSCYQLWHSDSGVSGSVEQPTE